MPSTITVDLSDDRGTLIKLAQCILQFTGYVPEGAAVPEKVEPYFNEHRRKGEIPDPGHECVPKPVEVPTAEAAFAQSHPAPPVPPAPVVAQNFLPATPDQNRSPILEVPAPPAPAGIDLDSSGLPWDVRIHSASRAKVTDGTWRQKRNVDPALQAKVSAELRALMAIPSPVPPVQLALPVPPVPPAPVVAPAAPVVAPPAPVVAPPAPVVAPPAPFAASAAVPAPPVSTSVTPASPGAAATASPGDAAKPAPTFPQLMQAITKAFTEKRLDQAQIQAAVASAGVQSLPMLASRPDLVGAVATALGLPL